MSACKTRLAACHFSVHCGYRSSLGPCGVSLQAPPRQNGRRWLIREPAVDFVQNGYLCSVTLLHEDGFTSSHRAARIRSSAPCKPRPRKGRGCRFLASKLASACRSELFLFVRHLEREPMMTTNSEVDFKIPAAIAATLARRRSQYTDQPQAWRTLCEAAFVAGLPEPARAAFLSNVTTQRGADIALRLREHAASIRAAVVQHLERRSTNPCMHPSPTASSGQSEA